MNGLVDRDALGKERKEMSWDESSKHYLQTEMIDPLKGAVILGGFVADDNLTNDDGYNPLFPVLRVALKGKIYQVVVSMDDEMNDGGRLFIEEEEKNG